MRKLVLLLAVGCGGGGGGEEGAPPVSYANSPMGTNLATLRFWSTQWAFVDAFKQCAPWQSQSATQWNDGQTLSLDANGWVTSLLPGQYAGTLMFYATQGRYPGGDYVCLYEGEGTLQFGMDATVVGAEPGRIVVNVVPDQGIHLQITSTNPANYVRNIRMMMPGFEHSTATFHPVFLAELAPFRVLRNVHWSDVIGSTVEEWSQRVTPETYSQGLQGRGVCYEYLIDLANELGADPWLCLPHRASDDYIAQFAALVRDRLAPGRRAYIEYSNECWNGQYSEAAYCQERGLALGLSGNAFTAQMRFYAQRAVEIFGICANVLGLDRMVRVLAVQAGNPWTGLEVMDWQNAYQSADALAVAPYIGMHVSAAEEAAVEQMTVDQVLDDAEADIPVVMGMVAQHAQNAAARGLPLIAYEGGHDSVGLGSVVNNDTIANLFYEANRAPRIRTVMRSLYDAWRAAGGRTFVQFTSTGPFTRYGSCNYKEYHLQSPTPKYDAILEFVEANPRWW